jgi:hypothetical protein
MLCVLHYYRVQKQTPLHRGESMMSKNKLLGTVILVAFLGVLGAPQVMADGAQYLLPSWLDSSGHAA